MKANVSEADRARGVLSVGLMLFRWAALAWMIALALTVPGGFARPGLAWAGIAAAGAWTVWMTIPGQQRSSPSLWIELALALGIIVLGGLVAPDGAVVTGRPFYATAWPVAVVAAWGVSRGVAGGVGSALAVGAALVVSRVVNGMALDDLTAQQVQSLANGTMTYVLAGGAVGLVASLLERSAAQFQTLTEETMRARERAARAAERESMARAIHDSVLQSLALVHKRGRELAATGAVSGEQVALLAEMAGAQEAELRALILREPDEPPTGQASLRVLLEEVARSVIGVPVSVSAVGPIWMGAHAGAELALAVRQSLDNVVEHAAATRATVFAEVEGDSVSVTVRDDGRGFDYDETELRTAGKAGMLYSMAGRVETLGGSMNVVSAPGTGCEIEFHVPLGNDHE